MSKNASAGEPMEKFLEWLERALKAESWDKFLLINESFMYELKAEAFPSALIRIRRVKTYPENASLDDLLRSEVYIEFVESGTQSNPINGKQGEFVGCSYFDRRDITI
jgi:hypothetical protein